MFMYDIKLPRGNTTTSPTRPPFIMNVIGQLQQLRSILLNDALSGGPATNGTAANVDLLTDRLPNLDTNDDDVTVTDVEEPTAEGAADPNGAESSNGEKDKERKSLINLCKTSQYLFYDERTFLIFLSLVAGEMFILNVLLLLLGYKRTQLSSSDLFYTRVMVDPV
jgi:hypothetical protein